MLKLKHVAKHRGGLFFICILYIVFCLFAFSVCLFVCLHFPKCKFVWLCSTFSFKIVFFLFVCFQYHSFSVTRRVILHSNMNVFRVAFGQLYKVK